MVSLISIPRALLAIHLIDEGRSHECLRPIEPSRMTSRDFFGIFRSLGHVLVLQFVRNNLIGWPPYWRVSLSSL